MSNINENRLNATLVVADVTTINTAVTTILSKLPANSSLSDDQRSSYNAIDVANKVFCDNVLAEAQLTGTGIISSYVSLAALKNDLDLYTQMNIVESQLMNVLQRVQDIKRVAGHEAYKVSNIIYGDYNRASTSGVDNAQSAYANLKSRYDAQTAGRPVTQNE
jgi:hypothetical protein